MAAPEIQYLASKREESVRGGKLKRDERMAMNWSKYPEI